MKLLEQIDRTAEVKEKIQLAVIEAALYVSGRPLDLKTIGSMIRVRSEDRIRRLSRLLMDRYKQAEGALEILELADGRFVMQLKPDYVRSARHLATRKLLTPGPLKTLSFIAIKQPVTQAYVVKVRGKLAYQHVVQLKSMGLIADDDVGRTKVLRTTDNFADYFNLSHDLRLMKRQLEKLFKDLEAVKTGEVTPLEEPKAYSQTSEGGSSAPRPPEESQPPLT